MQDVTVSRDAVLHHVIADKNVEIGAPEAGLVMAHALVHQIQQQLLGQDVDLQRAVAAGPVPEREEDPAPSRARWRTPSCSGA